MRSREDRGPQALRGHLTSETGHVYTAIAEANDCVVVTDNEKDFTGLKFVNPLRA